MIKSYKLLLICALTTIGCSMRSHAQLPKYYFDIVDVSSTSYSFKEDDKTYKFRAVTVQPEEYSFIAIELFELGKERDKTKLRDSFYVKDADFGVIVISEVEFLEWLSPKELRVRINNEGCYTLNFENYKEGIKVDECSD